MKNNPLLFRRQFLITPVPCHSLAHWQHQMHAHYHIYAHPDLMIEHLQAEDNHMRTTLLGYMIDPYNPDHSNSDVLQRLVATAHNLDDVPNFLYDIAGRFVLIVTFNSETFVFHDPCGLRTFYYTRQKGAFYAGSQPEILKLVIPVQEGDRFHSFLQSDYKKNHIEYWIPGGLSLFEDIHHLIPNHYLNISSTTQVRYWPVRTLLIQEPGEAVIKAGELIRKLLEAGNKRFPLAVTVTAGLDSRVLLSGCKSIAGDSYFYTLKYRHLNSRSDDLRIPRSILSSLGYPHHVIDCLRAPDSEFSQIYERNVPVSHADWARIAFGMHGVFPQHGVATKGSALEIMRFAYHIEVKRLPITSSQDIIDSEPGWADFPFICQEVSNWYDKALPICEKYKLDILDLFYWEHRIGSWQGRSQLEWDIVQETYCPFGHRGLIELVLGVQPEYRSELYTHPQYPGEPSFPFFTEICRYLWPEVMQQQVNPSWIRRHKLKLMLRKWGIERLARNIQTRLK